MGIFDKLLHRHPEEVDNMGNGPQQYADLEAARAKTAADQEAVKAARPQALEEHSGEVGVVTGKPVEIRERVDEITAETPVVAPAPAEAPTQAPETPVTPEATAPSDPAGPAETPPNP